MLGPCDNCPFRLDVPAYIRVARGLEIHSALDAGGFFPCHKTVDYDADDYEGEGRVTGASQWCAGALVLMERAWADEVGAERNQMVRIMQRVGGLDLDRLDMDAPVPDSFEAWIDHLRQGDHPT